MSEGEEQTRGKKGKQIVAIVLAMALGAALMGVALLLSANPVTTPPTPQAQPPGAPIGVRGVSGDGTVTVSWDGVSGATAYHLYVAQEPGVAKDNFASKPGGARFADVASPYILTGLTNDQTYYFRATAANADGESRESAEVSLRPLAVVLPPTKSLYVTGLVELDNGEPATGAAVLVRAEDYSAAVTAITGEDGRFNVGLTPTLPGRVLVTATYAPAGIAPATGFRWSVDQAGEGAVDVGRLVLPEASSKGLALTSGVATSADGSITVLGVPAEMASLYAQSYVADDSPDVYPGDLAEGPRTNPINNVVFLWITALDAAGNHVSAVDPAATVRLRVPASQWVDLEDLQPGNGVIDTPIYSLDYTSGYWVREADGRLTDATGNPIAESSEADIRAGVFTGDVFAEFLANHFSWWNVDKPPKICAGEFGDAPDPTYPTKASSNGVYHRDMCRAWLGAWVDADFTAQVPNKDIYDDGLLAVQPVKVRVANWNFTSTLYLNVLVDSNDDGDFADANEWIVQNLHVSVATGKYKVVTTSAYIDTESWIRLTLTGESITAYDGHGTYAIGETEDHRFIAKHPVSVYVRGNGTVTSSPAGIDCREYQSGDCHETYHTGEVVTLTATPDAGESFLYWSGDCAFAGSSPTCPLTMGQGGLSYWVVATFSKPPPPPPPLKYYLWVRVYGNGSVNVSPPGFDCRSAYGCYAAYVPGTVVTLTATPDAGETFLGWGADCQPFGTNLVCTLVMDRDRVASASFSQSFFDLYVWVTGNGTVTSSPAGIDCKNGYRQNNSCYTWFAAGTVVTLTATPESGAIFQTWTTHCASAGTNPVCTLTMDSSKRVGAAFTQSTLDLYVYVVGNGTVTSDVPGIDCRAYNYFNNTPSPNCHAWFPVGTFINLTASPDPGESFLGWAAQCEGFGTNSTCMVVIGEVPYTTYVVASFTQPYYLLSAYVWGNGTVTSAPAGIDCHAGRDGYPNGTGQGGSGVCAAEFQRDTNVTLTATPETNQTFLGWSGDCSAAGNNTTCVVYMDSAKYVYAQFTETPRLFVYRHWNTTGNGTVDSAPAGISCRITTPPTYGAGCWAYFPRGSTVVLTATPDPGSTFLEWTGACTGSNPVCTIVMDTSKYVYARFG